MDNNLQWDEFIKVEMRVGTVITAEIFEEARNPSYKMTIDFGKYGLRKTSAQITKLYKPEEIIGKQIVAVTNFPEKQIANIMSQCLVLGAMGRGQQVTLINPESNIENGTRIG
ncbi:MAG: tRNA-binding protein [Flavobacteriaceae bacterium]|nr:tRNA-binding protein [Flavobacteriaceae bacterium]